MSGATYRIEVEHNPTDPVWPYTARIYRQSDDFPLGVRVGGTAEFAVGEARAAVEALTTKQETVVLYVDDEGQDADAPHSVKA